MLECPDHPFARYVSLTLQPWLNDKKNWPGAPRDVAMRFVDLDAFKEVAEAFQRRQALIWAVKQGRRTGVFCNK